MSETEMTTPVAIALAFIGAALFFGIVIRLTLEFRTLRNRDRELKAFLASPHAFQAEVDALYVTAHKLRTLTERTSVSSWHAAMEVQEALDRALLRATRGLLRNDAQDVLRLRLVVLDLLKYWDEPRVDLGEAVARLDEVASSS